MLVLWERLQEESKWPRGQNLGEGGQQWPPSFLYKALYVGKDILCDVKYAEKAWRCYYIEMHYRDEVRALLSPLERRVFEKLNSPQKVQDFLDKLEINFEDTGGEAYLSPRQVLAKGKAQCIQGALFAATTLSYHGAPPLLMDFKTTRKDEDHVVALFKQDGLWGAISKTNHVVLRWRDPVYKNPRELAMSYFNEYYLWSGKKSMRGFSKPFDLRRYPPAFWITTENHVNLKKLERELDASPHEISVTKKILKNCRHASPIELRALELNDFYDARGKTVG